MLTNWMNPKMHGFAKLLLHIEKAKHENLLGDTVSGRAKMKGFNKLFAQTDL